MCDVRGRERASDEGRRGERRGVRERETPRARERVSGGWDVWVGVCGLPE